MADNLARARAARGTKRRCESCEQPFYDLMHSPIICPNCGEKFTPAPPVEIRSKKGSSLSLQNASWHAGTPRKPTPVAATQAGDDDAAAAKTRQGDEAVSEDADDENADALLLDEEPEAAEDDNEDDDT